MERTLLLAGLIVSVCIFQRAPAEEPAAVPKQATHGILLRPTGSAAAEEPAALPKATIDGLGPDWKQLTGEAFQNANCDPDTWTWDGGQVHCTGKPVGVTRSLKVYTNFELVAQWRHLESGGNSGLFVWSPPEAFVELKPGKLPRGGIEVQVLDHGFTEKYERRTKKKPDWFTTNGDVFPVGTSQMSPFEPISPRGDRSFPRKQLSKGVNQWNHYYVRAINGEIRLWVNGEEVSGGNHCQPASGYLCLESEGAPVDFRELRIRELP
ncbi:MAG TPA: DUF1080 domain-containing protein [Pirellulales bacterium]|jgi:hypothetical protein|nr:DUF1080 domain-containing protein [Pirellulales bacterium]